MRRDLITARMYSPPPAYEREDSLVLNNARESLVQRRRHGTVVNHCLFVLGLRPGKSVWGLEPLDLGLTRVKQQRASEAFASVVLTPRSDVSETPRERGW